MLKEELLGFELSPQQRYLWWLQQRGESAVYRSRSTITVYGELDSCLLASAIRNVVANHELLRTRFQFLPGMSRPLQVISEEVEFEYTWYDLSDLPLMEMEVQRQNLLEVAFERDSDGHWPPLRMIHLSFEPTSHWLVIELPAMHTDAAGLGLLVQQIRRAYLCCRDGQPLPKPSMQYADVAQTFSDCLELEEFELGRRFWADLIEKSLSNSTTPFGSATDVFRPRTWRMPAAKSLSRRVHEFCGRLDLGPESVLLACWGLLMSRLAAADEVVIGIGCDGRTHELLREAAGLLSRHVPFGFCGWQDESFEEIVRRVDLFLNEIGEAQYYFDPDTFQEMASGASRQFTGVFEYVHRLECRDPEEPVYMTESLFSIFDRFIIKLTVIPNGAKLSCWLEYDSSTISESDVARVGGSFTTLLDSALTNPSLPATRLEILSPEERRATLEFSQGSVFRPDIHCVHELFARQSQNQPDAIALVDEQRQISYEELNLRANKLGRYLSRLGVGPEIRVALCLRRSMEMVVAILGVFKAGGAYVPLDMDYPKERIDYILDDIKAPVLITESALLERAPKGSDVVCMDRDWRLIDQCSAVSAATTVSPENLAYVIYTSGSTGRPKGVGIEQRELVNYVKAIEERLSLGVGQRMGLMSTMSADLGHTMLFSSLCLGGELHVLSEERVRDSRLWEEYRGERRLECVKLTPTHLETLLRQKGGVPSRLIVLGGEVCRWELVRRVMELEPVCVVFNHYGPTECTVGAVAHRVAADEEEDIPIGKPLSNVRTYVLDREYEIVGVMIPGECYIGGDGVGRGYLHDAALTAERFVPDGLSGKAGARLYQTGDKMRWRADGELEYLGRLDGQVKVRGYRIELEEIETVLKRHSAVRQCVVIVREDEPGDQRLAAYVVPSTQDLSEDGDLREYLRKWLPEYMLPSAFVQLERMPMTANGKLDRKALPKPESTAPDDGNNPRTPVEEIVAGIWADVLRRKQVGAEENFFDLGGHSLLATQVVSRVRESLKVELPLREFFESPTVASMAKAVGRERGAGRVVEAPPIRPVSREVELPLSFAQQRLWFIQQLEPESAAYNIPTAVWVKGELQTQGVWQSLGEIERRHEVLRTRFEERDGDPVQVIGEAREVEVWACDLSGVKQEEREECAREITEREGRRPFALDGERLWRAGIIRLDEKERVLMLCLHHVVSDGWSMGVTVREFSRIYESYQAGRQSPLEELEVQYADYAIWQREWLQGEALARQLEYWRAQLAGAPVLELPTDRPRPAIPSRRGANVPLRLPGELTSELKQLSRREGMTLFMTLLTGFQALLARYSGQADIVVGTPIAGRNRAEIEGLIGFFVNTLAIRSHLGGDATVSETLGQVREAALEAYAHQDLPFEKLVEELQPQRNLSHQPLFQIMMVFQNAPREAVGLANLQLVSEPPAMETSKFDLMLSLTEVGGELQGVMQYATDLFDRNRIIRLLEHLQRLLQAMSGDAGQRLGAIDLMSEAERQQVCVEWNATEIEYDPELNLLKLFEGQVEWAPDKVAAVYQQEQLSYAELNRRANRLASYLRSLGVGAEVKVGLHLQRSLEMVIGLLGVLKAGGAYLPLDPSYPSERLAFMVDDAQPLVLLAHSRIPEKLPRSQVRRLELDREWRALEIFPETNPEFQVASQNLAYLIYTSGSSGTPKGVMITHGGLTNYLLWAAEAYCVDACSASVVHSSISFDLTVTGLLAPLQCGVTVKLIEEMDAVGTLLKAAEISDCNSLVKLTPGQLNVMREGLVPEQAADVGRILVIGGEALTWEELEYWRRHAAATRLINEYGPTETVVGCCVYEAVAKNGDSGAVPIGRPIANTRLYVVEDAGELALTGAKGELYIGGEGVSRGYWKQADLTAERFVPDWLSGKPGEQLYRTGDQVRSRTDGQLEYVGRLDDQVKVKGYRIELGEIESVLAEHVSVSRCAVCVHGHEPGDKRLIAYFVPAGEDRLTSAELRSHLQAKLPEYMVPAVFVELSELPLTANGKIDRKALPNPQPGMHEGISAPRDTTELQLFQIWSDVLRRDDFGIRDNFFDLGGHSFAAITLSSRVSDVYRKYVPIRIVFESPTIELMADYLRSKVASTPPSVIVPIQPCGTRRPFFGIHPGGGLAHYYIPLAQCLDKDQPFYGLQVYGLESGQTLILTVEEMASKYLAEIRRIQSAGPYRIGGYSFGGLVAYEMAQQLLAAGEDVSLLVLFDTGVPSGQGSDLPLSEEELLEPRPEYVIQWLNLFGLQADESEVRSMPIQDFAQLYMSRHGIKGDYDTFLQLYRAAAANAIARSRYRLKPYPGRITLFRGNDPGELDRGWNQLAPGRVEVYCFDAGHAELLSPPNGPALADKLSYCLDEADRAG